MSNWNSRTYRLSINQSLINKNDHDDKDALTHGWQNCGLTLEELSATILNGVAYCVELSGSRRTANFVASDIISIDINGTRTIEEVMADPFFKKHASIYYTTPSHSKDISRFRIIFGLEDTITDYRDMRAATWTLAMRLGGDPSVVDPTRLFYGNDQAEGEYFNAGISSQLLKELIEQGKNSNQSANDLGKSATATGVSSLVFKPDLIFVGVDGSKKTVNELSNKEQLYCPFHRDDRASAFVTQNLSGEHKGIHCTVCKMTFWPEAIENNYDFFWFDRAAKELLEHSEKHEDYGLFSDFMPDHEAIEGMQKAKIQFISQKYLPEIYLDADAIFIKSPKGSGKTQKLETITKDENLSILLIGHRQSLIRQSCKRLGLNCYLDYQKTKPPKEILRKYGVCLDSLQSIPYGQKFDIIVIDESEQVLSHFLSSTLDKKRNQIAHSLRDIVSRSKHVLAMDADLGWNTFRFFSAWSRQWKKDAYSRLVINEWFEEKGDLQVYENENQIVGDLRKSLAAGLRCYVTSNSKKLIDNVCASITEEICDPSKMIRITSDTTNVENKDVSEFLERPSEEAQKYQAIFATPSVSTGVDISFPDQEQVFDVVYGIFKPLILSHFDCDQQLSRVRHPKEVKVFVSPRSFFL